MSCGYDVTELLPCPFCGGEAYMEDAEIDGRAYYIAKCGTCCSTSGVMQMSRSKAIEAWNTRAERTCCNDLKDSDFGNVWPIPHFKCSTCGGLFASYEFDYCPSCGAKVVEK